MKDIPPELRRAIWLELGFSKAIKIGYIRGDYFGYSERSKLPVIVNVEFKPDLDSRILGLSFTGDILTPRGGGVIACGQIDDTIRDAIRDKAFIPTVPKTVVNKLLEYWKYYHLNDIRPVPEEKAIEYFNCLEKVREMSKEGLDVYEFMKECIGEDYGNKWYKWKIPNSVYRWILAKLCGLKDKEINHLTRLKQILEGDLDE